jgi:hypothetical protein
MIIQTIPTTYARSVKVDSTIEYMGSLMTLFLKGSETGGRSAKDFIVAVVPYVLAACVIIRLITARRTLRDERPVFYGFH